MRNLKPTIGLEIHAELKTQTKMFCDSLNDPNEQHPNINICPICVGHPGTLPTINKKAVEQVIRVGIALGGRLAEQAKFDRKNYFYPDLPKGYQISQYDAPLVSGGKLLGVRLRRVHLEEDTGRLLHTADGSLVDFNRAGVPLMELVTEPDITSAQQAAAFARELQVILRYLGVSDADMEKGQLRVEANVSWNMGIKVELKNINSFKAVEEAIDGEFRRQRKLLESGKKIVQETRGWDDVKGMTVSQRSKEESHDYRYFPEPDLPPFNLKIFDLELLRREIPELPMEKRRRFAAEFQLKPEQAETLVQDRLVSQFFEEAVSELLASSIVNPASGIQLLFNYFTTDLWGLMAREEVRISELKVSPRTLADLIGLLLRGEISSRTAKDTLLKMFHGGADPHQLIVSENLGQVSEAGQLQAVVEKVIAENPKAVADYRRGKTNVLQYLVGRANAELRGRGQPQELKKLFEEKLILR